MAPQMAVARTTLRAIHRLEALQALRRASRDLEGGQQPAEAIQGAENSLQQSLLDTITPEEAVAADVRTARPSSMLLFVTPLHGRHDS